jgi:hypothetical protein
VTAAKTPHKSDPPRKDSTRVALSDLARLEAVHALLSALNDARAGAVTLAKLVERVSPLRARLAKRFRARFPSRPLPRIPEQLALLGNQELESALLQVLEDLTVLRADADEAPAGERRS